jgi:hypothetical protein
MEKIYITGTGRCGTTFLIKLFTFLGFDTGFTEDNYDQYILKNCNSGMEKSHNDSSYVIKNPVFIEYIESIINDPSVRIKCIILPIRKYQESAKSRVGHGTNYGGLWNASNEDEQCQFYNKLMANYMYIMTKHDIPTIFLDFDRMIHSKEYLFEKLKGLFTEKAITFDTFSDIYEKVSLTSRPAPPTV